MSEAAEKCTNASGNVEERSFQRRGMGKEKGGFSPSQPFVISTEVRSEATASGGLP